MSDLRTTFETAFQDLYPRALRLARRIAGPTAAEDVAAEALARAYGHWSRIGASEAYRTGWVLRVTTNLAIDTLRGREHPSERVEPEGAEDPQDALTLRVALVEALRALPQRQREAVALRYLAGLSQADVAATLGISPGSVAQHVHRGLRVLRGQFFEPGKEKVLKVRSLQEAASLAGTSRVVQAQVLGVWKIGWNVDIGIPALLVARGQSRGQTTDPESLVGQTLEVHVSEVDPVRERVVVMRPVSEEEDESFRARRDLIAALSVGEVRSGRVYSVLPFGAFVDVGGVYGLVHKSEQPTPLAVGQDVEVEVLETKPEQLRVSLRAR
jgi:RNA polymerase sigma factor (sigma-70 family)